MKASDWLLGERTSEAEHQETQRRAVEKGVGSEEASLKRPSMGPSQPISVSPSGSEMVGLYRVAGRWRDSGAIFVGTCAHSAHLCAFSYTYDVLWQQANVSGLKSPYILQSGIVQRSHDIPAGYFSPGFFLALLPLRGSRNT